MNITIICKYLQVKRQSRILLTGSQGIHYIWWFKKVQHKPESRARIIGERVQVIVFFKDII